MHGFSLVFFRKNLYIIRRWQSNAIIFYVIMEDTVDARELKLKHPFSMLLSGARRTGKTFLSHACFRRIGSSLHLL